MQFIGGKSILGLGHQLQLSLIKIGFLSIGTSSDTLVPLFQFGSSDEVGTTGHAESVFIETVNQILDDESVAHVLVDIGTDFLPGDITLVDDSLTVAGGGIGELADLLDLGHHFVIDVAFDPLSVLDLVLFVLEDPIQPVLVEVV